MPAPNPGNSGVGKRGVIGIALSRALGCALASRLLTRLDMTHHYSPKVSHVRSQGFSLIEVLVVMVIIGILAALGVAGYARYRARGFDAKVVAAVRGVATAQEAHFATRARYTGDLVELGGGGAGGVVITLGPGNSGSLISSFRVGGSHSAAEHDYAWVSDPLPGEQHLTVN